jgi:hypothetical protein
MDNAVVQPYDDFNVTIAVTTLLLHHRNREKRWLVEAIHSQHLCPWFLATPVFDKW